MTTKYFSPYEYEDTDVKDNNIEESKEKPYMEEVNK